MWFGTGALYIGNDIEFPNLSLILVDLIPWVSILSI